jgi:uncharacterized membrane protein (DUF485 family)
MSEPQKDLHGLSAEEHLQLSQQVMRRQAALSLRVAAVFLLLLFGLPLFNLYLPNMANASVFGFTVSWLFLGVLFFPITVLLAAYFVRQSDRIESECSDWRAILGIAAGEPLEPEGVGDVRPAFIADDEEASR